MSSELVTRRLRRQRLDGGVFPDAEAAVSWFGALQAQDYPAAVWAIAQRTAGLVRADVDADYQAGRLIRTHVLRPTWHLVAPDDLRWLLELTGGRVHQANGTMYRRSGLDAASLAAGEQLVVEAIAARGPLIRTQLSAALEDAGFPGATGLRGTYVLMAAELDRLICSAGFAGKQHAYALFDDRVPPSPPLDRDEALRRLAILYYRGHGPATPADLAWWSGLTLGDARVATVAARDALERSVFDGTEFDGAEFWATRGDEPAPASEAHDSPDVTLLPNFDEYTVAYRDRRGITGTFSSEPDEQLFLRHLVLVDGLVSGGWRNVTGAKEHLLEVRFAIERDAAIEAGVRRAAERYGRVNGVAVRVEYPS